MEVAVIGLGKFASSIAKEIEAEGGSVLAIDINTKKVQEISQYVSQTAIADATDKQALRELSIEHFDAVVVGLGTRAIDKSLLCVHYLNTLGVKKIIAKATTEAHAELLNKIGICKIVNPEDDMGKKIAAQMMKSSILDIIKLSNEYRMESVLINDFNKKIVNKTIQEINLRKNFSINIVCIQRGDDIIIVESDTLVLANDIILVVGKGKFIDKFEEKYGLGKV